MISMHRKHFLECVTLFVVLYSASFFVQSSDAYLLDDNPYRHMVTLDPQGKYQLEWLVDWDTRRVVFNVTVATTGYVGFGLSRKGKMSGADIVIGGVGANGKPYFKDRYAIGNQLPEIDESQDWTLHTAWEREKKTFLSFSRPFDTCDEDHDLPINEHDSMTLIWAYSEVDDEIQYHFQTRGTYDVYLLDPDLTPRAIEKVSTGYKPVNLSIFNISKTLRVPRQDTAYWCSIYKVPTSKKQHIIGFNTVFPTDKDRRFVHHLLLHRCRPPPGTSSVEFFEAASRTGGSECYILGLPNPLPIPYCRETIHVWAVGGRAIFFPEHAGLPMSESPDEYFMFQVHYDNPLNVTTEITVNLELYHTSNLRENDVGLLQLGNLQPGATSILIPPSSPSHSAYGHCAPGCTKRIFPPEGVNVFAAFLHTHISGRGIRALHFRERKEFPYVQADDNYNFNYQQFRILREERKILPGDQVILNCIYDSTNSNGSVVHGGFSTREEMCSAFMYYYSRVPGFSLCRSEIREREYWNLLGIRNATWNMAARQMIVSEPPEFRGFTVRDYANNFIDWTIQMRESIQRLQTYLPQVSQCPRFYFENPSEQIRHQLDSGILERTGRLPGSDGRAYLSVDEDIDHISILPRDIPRYRRPAQCSRRGTLLGKQEKGNELH